MRIALTLFAGLIVLASGAGVFFPALLFAIVREAVTGPGLWLAAVARLVLAVLLWFSAPVSHTPNTFRILALLVLMGAIFIVIAGSGGVLELIDLFAAWPQWGVRLLSLAGLGFGAFLLWSISRRPQEI